MKETTFKFDETSPEPDHHLSFSFTDTFDEPKTLRATIVVKWCKYKEQVAELEALLKEARAEAEHWKREYRNKGEW